MFICGESSPKFQMYNEQKINGALIREKSKCHNWNTRKCRKSTQVRNFNPQSARKGNWERLWGKEGRFPYTHISIPKLQNCKNVSWLNGLLVSSFSSMGKNVVGPFWIWLGPFILNLGCSKWLFLVNRIGFEPQGINQRGYGQIWFNWVRGMPYFLHNLRNKVA